MIRAVCLALALAGPPGGADADVDARAELDACAARIEELKARRRAGQAAERELERLLVRAQELAIELERTRAELPVAPPSATSPSPEELRERADAARDEADRLSAEIAELDVKLGDARRNSDSATAGAALGIAPASPSALARIRELQLRRHALAERRAAAESDAARLEAEARAADSVR
ncbi:MAG TPA: hypothetical protein VF841_21215 [Anaeromyxobacter sp.]